MTQRISAKTLFLLATLIILGWIFYQALPAVLLLMTAAIVATGLHQGASRLSGHLPGSRKLWLFVIILGLVGLLTALITVAGPRISSSFGDLQNSLAEAWERVSSMDVVKQAMGGTDNGTTLPDAFSNRLMDVGRQLGNLAALVIRIVTGALLILALAMFLVWNPDLYERGFLSLFPQRFRPRLAEVLHKAGESLWFWLTGQGIAMLIIGILTGLGLWLVGMKFAILLGVIAGLFQIIPYVGPFLSAVPGIVLALAVSPTMVLSVVAVYVGVQLIESNFITPTVLRSEASVPPVLTLISTAALGLVFGPLGFIIATPLTVIGLVFYRELYGEMVLGEDDTPQNSSSGKKG
jgi:predicted PurR-regulated permease PerM